MKRLLSLALCVILVFGVVFPATLPLFAFAHFITEDWILLELTETPK